MPDLIANGRIEYAWLGLSGVTLNSDLARAMDLEPDQRGILVTSVVDDGPTAQAKP